MIPYWPGKANQLERLRGRGGDTENTEGTPLYPPLSGHRDEQALHSTCRFAFMKLKYIGQHKIIMDKNKSYWTKQNYIGQN